MIDESESSVVEELDSVADEYVSELQVTMEDGEVVRNKKYSGTKKRYLILGLFIALSASNSFQWIEYAIVAHAIVKFYNVSYALVDWTSVIYMLTYIAFVIPASWFLNKYGLRKSLLIGSTGNFVGALIKYGSTNPGTYLFWLSFLGQTIVGSSQVFFLGVPPRLAAVWFSENQLSTACAAGVFGNQLGIAAGFLIPPLIVNTETIATIKASLDLLFMASAIVNVVIFLLILIFFAEKPSTDPSTATVRIGENGRSDNFFSSLKQLIKNQNFVLFFIAYGINVGVFYAVSTLLSQVILHFFPGEQTSTGTIGLLIVVAGMFGSVAIGFVLDKTHQYKETVVAVYALSLFGTILYTVALIFCPIAFIYVIAAFLGFFMTGYLPIGFEFGVEITYPITESTTSGLLNLSAQVFGTTIILIMGQLITEIGVVSCNILTSAILLIGFVLTVLIKPELRRQNLRRTKALDES
uniref:MFS domain-containing protein n=1 Tax=Syphacia muris TaxID=451379 RepID=A0A0N5ARS0_9BILA